ncbi:MAG: restriction endonuclease [Deltaproteobacteria bacterium]|nr:restriction endonuclease [Deltaproteobacteria bacterium]
MDEKTKTTANSLSAVPMKENFENLHYSDTRCAGWSDPWVAKIGHLGLGTSCEIRDMEKERRDNKVAAQFKKWDEQWVKIGHKNKSQANKVANLNIAEERTRDAQEKLKQIDNLLICAIENDNGSIWDSLKDTKEFEVPNPKYSLNRRLSRMAPPAPPAFRELPQKPEKGVYKPTQPEEIRNWRGVLIPSQIIIQDESYFIQDKARYQEAITAWYQEAITAWQKSVDETNSFNSNLKEQYEKKLKECEEENQTVNERINERIDALEKDWEREKEAYNNNQKEFNDKIEKLKESYFHKNTDAIIQYCEMILNSSKYPDTFLNNFELEYNPENKILIIEYELPSLERFPKEKEVKYIASNNELKEYHISESQFNKMFDDATYKITLRSLHEIFEADAVEAIDAISFNGWVKSINKASGNEETNCILTIQVKKNEFLKINLSNVDPKACFKYLKGVASSKLSSLTPVQPILQMSRVDKRFVDGYNVTNGIDNTTNLAAMDWEDFEHLIRELFEQEFQVNGGEVKVTQASRDGGVDAIAFDPDPIRGGKIVIQAKRYTNTVSVSAVRDLYGTVLNEGATKGILVSTADYGPDAYEFAKGKPITLLSGSNLLHLLEKHGHHAKIDLRDAKRILAEKDKLTSSSSRQRG